MKSPYNFIISPYGDVYNNTKEIDGVSIVINTSLEIAKYVNRVGVVFEVPINYNGDIKKGDLVILHHNIFRTYYDMKGRQTKSPEFFRDDIYIVSRDRIYMYSNGKENWIANDNYCFVRPIDNENSTLLHEKEVEEKHKGLLEYPNQNLINQGYNKGDLIAFKKNSEYAFEIDDDKFYRMTTNDILLKLN